MKKTFLLLAAVISLAACKSGDKKAPGATGDDTAKMSKEKYLEMEKEKAAADSANSSFTTIEWLDPITKDLGKLKKDKEVEITFRFKNSGRKNLVIESVTAQCGCTIPEKPEQPFAPGEEGVIKAKFNGSGSGAISKQVHVIANTVPQKDHTLTFTGEISDK